MSTTIPDSIHPSDLPEIGQPLADGTFFARQWLNGKEYAYVDLGKSAEFAGEWGEYGQSVDGAVSYRDGASNTIAMAEAGSPIAKQSLEIGEGVYSFLLFWNWLFCSPPSKQASCLISQIAGIGRVRSTPPATPSPRPSTSAARTTSARATTSVSAPSADCFANSFIRTGLIIGGRDGHAHRVADPQDRRRVAQHYS